MGLEPDDQKLVDALNGYARGEARQSFPFDDLRFTVSMAASRINQLSRALAAREGSDT